MVFKDSPLLTEFGGFFFNFAEWLELNLISVLFSF